MSVLLALGSNLAPRRHLAAALQGLATEVAILATSPVYRSDAVGGPPGSPPFLNAAVEVRWEGSPASLKHDLLRPLEATLGRVRTGDPNAPRTIDIDIALFGDLVVVEPPELVIPDPDTLTRAYLALPLADVAPARRHPLTDEPLARIAARLRTPAVRRELPDLGSLPPAEGPPAAG